MKELTLERFEEASEIVKKVTLPTKLVYSENLSRMTGGKVYLKPENMQCTGAYKVRRAWQVLTPVPLPLLTVIRPPVPFNIGSDRKPSKLTSKAQALKLPFYP